MANELTKKTSWCKVDLLAFQIWIVSGLSICQWLQHTRDKGAIHVRNICNLGSVKTNRGSYRYEQLEWRWKNSSVPCVFLYVKPYVAIAISKGFFIRHEQRSKKSA